MSYLNNNITIPQKSFFTKNGIEYEKFSILALSVYKANFDFIKKYTRGKILEIGCGSDSVIESNLKNNWFGIDVISKDRHGKPSLATKFGSVHDIPFNDGTFDYAISNQSIEHWYEYNISFNQAFSEINRILKIGGEFIFNFPIHLHGHKYFVLNSLSKIDNELKKCGFKITSKSKFISKGSNYEGWIKCGFPTLYLKLFSPNFQKTSFVMEYTAEKVFDLTTNNNNNNRIKKLSKPKSRFAKRFHHGLLVLLYNIYKKIIK